MRLYLINPSNPLVSIVNVKESRWNRYRVWKPLGLMVLAGLTPPEWETAIVDENLGVPDYQAKRSATASSRQRCQTEQEENWLKWSRVHKSVKQFSGRMNARKRRKTAPNQAL